ncbi:MAG: hypothetical protein LKE46_02990 [Clostridium sp.]|jgi:hypothetical protein|uniref:hypothetical protein n=1 Tax=Clostridium sp. TaxID=1506 RepID=UPI0025BB177E|nr:hypothetical protein [Clostridium sp.]MCH3963215.1 hypothetical protein [Clostridium sp.]MCI1716322.1 hypothetical protein [Clostridium sp.]MCI1800662.1 hypothetical protein [Clostridium sp.]MCI1814683.1 hypothetical protein [Clostridium sp.]MCI1871593.1 hypothetical protein [Clostridium sp.]
MDKNTKNFFRKLCKYCLDNYTISNSGPIISSLIYFLCKSLDIDAMAVRGLLTIHIDDNYSKNFAHCFNVYNGIIIDASIYQYALINRRIAHLVPMYIVETIPYHIEYTVYEEISEDYRFKFSHKFLENLIDKVESMNEDDIYPEGFDIIEDSRKQNLFYYR